MASNMAVSFVDRINHFKGKIRQVFGMLRSPNGHGSPTEINFIMGPCIKSKVETNNTTNMCFVKKMSRGYKQFNLKQIMKLLQWW